MIEWGEQRARRFFVATLDGERRLTRRRQQRLYGDNLAHGFLASQPLEASQRQEYPVLGASGIERLGDACVYVAAQIKDV